MCVVSEMEGGGRGSEEEGGVVLPYINKPL